MQFCESKNMYVSQSQEPLYEDESKQIRCLNAVTLVCCQYNQRTVLIVCSKYFQVIQAILSYTAKLNIYTCAGKTVGLHLAVWIIMQ